jgi:predicted Zn-dependent protease
LDEDIANWAFAGQLGLGILFLHYSRDDERQADDLGLRYAMRAGYDPNQMPELFRTLDAVSKVQGAGHLPSWLATHPDPGARRQRIESEVAALEGDFSAAKIERDSYLQRLDGMPFGDNPREGFFQGNAFLHPDLHFRIDFPQGWETANQEQGVSASAPGGEAMVQVSVSESGSREDAETEFLSQEGVTQDKSWESQVHGLPASWVRFEHTEGESHLRGTVAFVEHGGQIFQLLALSDAASWNDLRETLENAIGTFASLDDPKALAARASHIRVVRLQEDMTVERFLQAFPSNATLETIALINHVEQGGTLKKGTLAKRVVAE